MSNGIPHTIRLQDGSLCNLNKRMTRHSCSLLTLLRSGVTDPRKQHGKRHSLVLILMVVFIGLLSGSNDLKDAWLYARLNQRFFAQQLGSALPHGIPDPTTISRVFQQLDIEELITVCIQFLEILGIQLDEVCSFDGKTMRAVSGEGAIRHILSLFSHDSHLALGQVGVSSKENEIPALERLLTQGIRLKLIAGKLLLGDALHTQKATLKTILKCQADYLCVVKNNQKQLKRAIIAELEALPTARLVRYTDHDNARGRHVATIVTAATADQEAALLPSLTGSDHWDNVRTMGLLNRTGTRTSKDGSISKINETICFIYYP